MAVANPDRYFGGQYASAFQDATNASTRMAQEDFSKQQGQALGGLAKIGALRSGRVKTTLNDLTTNFGRQIGNVAASNAGQLAQLNAAHEEGDANRGVQREGIQSSAATAREGYASSERVAGNRLAFDSSNADRSFGYQASRDAVGDARYADTTAYSRNRDSVGDARYADEQSYSRGRDAVGDARDTRNFDYAKSTDDRNFGYQQGRDAVGDQRDERNFDYTKGQNDRTFNYQQGRDQVGDARYTDETVYNRNTDQRNFDYTKTTGDRAFGEQQRQFDTTRADQATAARREQQSQIAGGAVSLAGKLFGSGGILGRTGSSAASGTTAAAGAGGGLGTAATLGLAGAGIAGAVASTAANRGRVTTAINGANRNMVEGIQAQINSGKLNPQQLAQAQAALAHYGG